MPDDPLSRLAALVLGALVLGAVWMADWQRRNADRLGLPGSVVTRVAPLVVLVALAVPASVRDVVEDQLGLTAGRLDDVLHVVLHAALVVRVLAEVTRLERWHVAGRPVAPEPEEPDVPERPRSGTYAASEGRPRYNPHDRSADLDLTLPRRDTKPPRVVEARWAYAAATALFTTVGSVALLRSEGEVVPLLVVAAIHLPAAAWCASRWASVADRRDLR